MIRENILYFLAKHWPAPMAKDYVQTGMESLTEEYHLNYALYKQYLYKVNHGFPFNFFEKRVLEIGCGHGGICIYLALNGAKEVYGIDINSFHLSIADKFRKQTEMRLRLTESLPVNFKNMNAAKLEFPDQSFDLVVADNIFEHIMDIEQMMKEVSRILCKEGQLVIPAFNSIYSKYGLHLKHGLKVPWANIFFNEKIICNVMIRLANSNPKLLEYYAGLKNNPKTVRDLREYGDLNGMTYRKFKKLAKDYGFRVKQFSIHPPGNSLLKTFFRFTHRLPIIKNSLWSDVTSISATSVLEKV